MAIDWHEIPRHLKIENRNDLVAILIAAEIPVPNFYGFDDPTPPQDAEVDGAVHFKTDRGVITERVEVLIFKDVEQDPSKPAKNHGLACNILFSGPEAAAKANNRRLTIQFAQGARIIKGTLRRRKISTVELFDEGTRFPRQAMIWSAEKLPKNSVEIIGNSVV